MAYHDAHAAAAAAPSPQTYRAAGEQAMLMQSILHDEADTELRRALLDRDLEFTRQAGVVSPHLNLRHPVVCSGCVICGNGRSPSG